MGAPTASADLVNQDANQCTGTAKWTVNLAASSASVSVGPATCKAENATVEDNGNPHVNVVDHPFTQSYGVGLLGVTVTGTNSFAGVGTIPGGGGPVEVVSPGILNATLTAFNFATQGNATSQHTGVSSCGANCYRTTWVSTWVE